MNHAIETMVLIDNGYGVYSEVDVLVKLNSYAEEIDAAMLTAGEINDLENTPLIDRYQIAYEMELELVDSINEVLTEQGLCLTVGEVEPGIYLVESLEF